MRCSPRRFRPWRRGWPAGGGAIGAPKTHTEVAPAQAVSLATAQGPLLVSAARLRAHPSLDWWVVVALREDLLVQGIHRNAWRTALLSALAALLVLGLGTLVLRSLLGEVGALTRAAESVSADRTPAPLGSRRRDELGRLSDAFDHMVERLNTTAQVVRRQRGALEQHVAELADSRDQLRRLAGELLGAQAEERRSIARELHDEPGQQLAALRINLQGLQERLPAGVEPAAAAVLHVRLEDSLSIVQRTIEQVRSRALDLHPAILDDLGLAAALQWLAERQSQRSGVPITADTPAALPVLPPALALACYRIAQEAIGNAIRHAGPRRIDLALQVTATELRLAVEDDGIGFDGSASVPGRSLGLLGMRERAEHAGGTIEIDSQTSRGTRVQVRFPIVVLPP
jgi:signal transduction histidine kinase